VIIRMGLGRFLHESLPIAFLLPYFPEHRSYELDRAQRGATYPVYLCWLELEIITNKEQEALHVID
jgi:hypothetical protein